MGSIWVDTNHDHCNVGHLAQMQMGGRKDVILLAKLCRIKLGKQRAGATSNGCPSLDAGIVRYVLRPCCIKIRFVSIHHRN